MILKYLRSFAKLRREQKVLRTLEGDRILNNPARRAQAYAELTRHNVLFTPTHPAAAPAGLKGQGER